MVIDKVLKYEFLFSKVAVIAAVCLTGFSASAESWAAIKGKTELKTLYSNVTQQSSLTANATWRTEYCADGNGVLRAWGESFPRTLQIKDDETVCITSDKGGRIECFHFEKDNSASSIYRGADIISNKVWDSSGETV